METQAREIEIAQSALAELLRRHKAAGFSLTVMSQSMVAIGARALAGLLGGERAGEIVRNIADSAVLRSVEGSAGVGKPTTDDEREYVAKALDTASPSLDRDTVYCAAVVHGALSLAARRGGADVVAILADLIEQIWKAAADRQVRTGDPARDLN